METVELPADSLQPPFAEDSLLSVSDFIGYCMKYDNRTTQHELEYFEKERLLLPAVRVRKPIVVFRRVLADWTGRDDEEWRYVPEDHLEKCKTEYRIVEIEDKPIFSHGTIFRTKGWLSHYVSLDMVVFPVVQQFRPWIEYDHDKTWANSPEELGEAFETFYSSLEMYPLKFVKNHRSFTIKNSSLFMSDDQWGQIIGDIREIFTEQSSNTFIQQRVRDFYRVFRLLIGLNEFWMQRLHQLNRARSDALKFNNEEGLNSRQTLSLVDEEGVVRRVDETFTTSVKDLLRSHGFTIEELENWRLTFLNAGTFGLHIKLMSLRKPYLQRLDDQILANTEDPYLITSQLNWLIGLCGGEKATITGLLLGSSKYKECPYCHGLYEPKRRDQTNCGAAGCKNMHGKNLKHKWYLRRSSPS